MIDVEVNRLVMDKRYGIIISIGQVVPHEVAGMANHSKNIFVGVGGSGMINKSHMLGAVYGMERMMGRDLTPVRILFDFSLEHFLYERPIIFALTVATAPENKVCIHGLFIGDTRRVFEEAVKTAQEYNINRLDKSIKKCVVYLEPSEFKSTWLGNKAIYRTRMAIADGGELLILAPGIRKFGEDDVNDALIRKYGYRGYVKTLEQLRNNKDLRDNMSVAAHLIHGSSEDRFKITYAVRESNISRAEIEEVGFIYADYEETAKRYDPMNMKYGQNILSEGERIFFIPNPALGLWAVI
jgi:nickel-dependent lactate racemase